MYGDDLWTLPSTHREFLNTECLGIQTNKSFLWNQQNCWAIPDKNVSCNGGLMGWCRDLKTCLSPTCLLETSCKAKVQLSKLVVNTMPRNSPLFACCAVFARGRTWPNYSWLPGRHLWKAGEYTCVCAWPGRKVAGNYAESFSSSNLASRPAPLSKVGFILGYEVSKPGYWPLLGRQQTSRHLCALLAFSLNVFRPYPKHTSCTKQDIESHNSMEGAFFFIPISQRKTLSLQGSVKATELGRWRGPDSPQAQCSRVLHSEIQLIIAS